MAWPNGMELVTVTVGSSLSFFGDEQAIKVTVTPVIGGTVGRLVWAATGQPVVFGSKTFTGVAGTVASFTVPNPDQAGFIDGAGNAVTNWAYSAVVEVGSQRWTQAFQPVAGQSSIDLDMVQDGQVSAPVSAPVPAVTSVNGQTGAVVISGVGGEGGPVAWAEVLNKPSVFPPAAHQHSIGDVTGLQAALDAVEGVPGADGQDGADGLSAYQLAVQEGFVGTLTEYLASLKGADGADGADGKDGADGAGATIETLPAGIMLSARYDTSNDLWPARPTQRTDISVYWYGGTVKPADMLEGDVWVTSADVVPEQPADTEAPSVPTGLVASSITDTGFTLNWSASTDDTGVNGYEVSLDSVSYATPTGTTAAVTGRTAETTYAVAVRARDAAGNWSAYSSPLNVATGSSEPPVEPSGAHSIFADTAPPTLSINTDGTPSITTATGFYTFTAGAAGWRCVGGRQCIPAGSPAIGKTLTFALHPGGFNVQDGQGADLSLTPARSGTVTAVAGWNEVTWAPYELTPSARVYIATNTADGTYHSNAADLGDSAVPSPTSGNKVYLAEMGGVGQGPRTIFRIGTGNTSSSSSRTWYGQDILVDEGGA